MSIQGRFDFLFADSIRLRKVYFHYLGQEQKIRKLKKKTSNCLCKTKKTGSPVLVNYGQDI